MLCALLSLRRGRIANNRNSDVQEDGLSLIYIDRCAALLDCCQDHRLTVLTATAISCTK